MASGTAKSDSAEQASQSPRPDGRESPFDARMRTTRGQVKTVDVVTRLVALACFVLVYLLAATVFDHWVIPGGFGFTGRLLLFAGLVGGGSAYLLLGVLPLVVRRISPVYAALAIERNQPSLKNSLVNLLLLRRGRQPIAPAVYHELEEKAARDLSRVPVEGAVDRWPLVRAGYALLAVVALLGSYIVFSPKDPLRSIGRVMAPWSDAPVPTRVTIEDVRPGDFRAFHEEHVTVSAAIRGVDDTESPHVYWTSNDGRIVEHPIRMNLSNGPYGYEAVVPESDSGLQQSGQYYVAAGDARSPTFRVDVLTAPAILVDQVEYRYPAYTRLGSNHVERQGDLQAIEGTRVQLVALANREIESAWVDFGCDGRRDLRMSTEGRRARIEFELRLGEQGLGEHGSYQLLFTSTEGHENPRPIRHRIDIAADHPPQIRFLAPQPDAIDVPQNGAQELVVRAIDPDFALSGVRVRLERGRQTLIDEGLLDGEHAGPLIGKLVFRPSEFELNPGDELVYWGEALDNRQPDPQLSRTSKRRMRIVASSEQPRSQQESDPGEQAGHGDENRPRDDVPGDSGRSEDAEEMNDVPPEDDSSTKSAERDGAEPADTEESRAAKDEQKRIDPEANPGDAFEKIIEHQRQQERRRDRPSEEQGDGQAEQQPEGSGQGPDEESAGPAKSRIEGEEQSRSGSSEQNPEAVESGAGESGSGESGDRGKQSGDDSPGRSGAGGQNEAQQPASRQGPGDRPSGQQPPDGADKDPDAGPQSDPKAPGSSERPSGGEPRPQTSGGESQQRSGRGDRAQPSAAREDERRPDKQDSGVEAEGTDQPDPKGPPGAGQSEGDTRGSPSSKEPSRPRKKSSSPPEGADERPREEQPAAQSTSPRESDSEGGDDGERSGGGQRGGGQQADKPGTGGSGQNTAADEGAGSSAGKGQGPTSERPGSTSQSSEPSGGSEAHSPGSGRESPTGGERPGSGEQPDSGQRAAGPDKQPEENARPAGEPTAADRTDQRPESDRSQGADKPSGGQPTNTPSSSSPGGEHSGESGTPGRGPASGSGASEDRQPPPREVNEEPGGEDPNIEYARKATDLALEHLKDQLGEQDADDLLAQLGWTREDAERFIRRWELMKREAAADSPTAQGRLDEALSSLGLRRRGTELKGGRTRHRQLESVRQSQRSQPPADYLEQYRAFTEATSKSPRSGDER